MIKFGQPYGNDRGYMPGYVGPLGFAGVDGEPMVTGFDGKIFYVDPGHTNANDNNDGRDPQYPLESITELITRTTNQTGVYLSNYDTIYVSGSLEESVVTGDYTQMPSYVSIIGVGPSLYSPSWTSAAADEIALDLRCVGWRVSGFRFLGQASESCIVLRHTDTGANDIAIRTVIDNCYFDGLTTGQRGIESHGCYDVWISNCTFSLWNNAGNDAVGIEVTTTPLAIPYRMVIQGCHFYDNDNHAIVPMNGSRVLGCSFQKTGYAYTAVQCLETTLVANPGDDNMLIDNKFEGDFSLAGGYRFGTNDFVFSNKSDDTAEAEVDAAGNVIAIPT